MDFSYESDRIYLENEDGKVIAEISFPMTVSGVVNVNHTFVDSSLRGQGIADKLMIALTNRLEEKGLKASCSCSYAKSWTAKHPELAHIYGDSKAD